MWMNYRIAKLRIAILIIAFLSCHAHAADLKVMKQGLGGGRITSSSGINCGAACDLNGVSGTIILRATADLDSTFVRWEGDGATNPSSPLERTVIMSEDRAVRAVFALNLPIRPLTDFTPSGIRRYLGDPRNAQVTNPARFLSALPREFRQNWILMSRSESLQTGTAQYPRILLPSADARFVFSIGLNTGIHTSFPASHHNAVEYMQWDATEKNFRFHEIVLFEVPAMGGFPLRPRGIGEDDPKCTKCHSTRNVPNNSPFGGTDGIPPGTVKTKNKPNWDAYDSWGGMLPFNRDRIYQGSVEAAAFRSFFNLWNWRGSVQNDAIRSFLEQLQLQSSAPAPSPHAITRNTDETTDTGHIVFGFDGLAPIATTTATTNHSFGSPSPGSLTLTQGGRYVTLRHSNPNPTPNNDDYMNPASDEGRGVQFFDLLAGFDGDLNHQRIADELITHRFATGSVPIDVRPIALAISRGLLSVNAATNSVTSTPELTNSLAFFNARHGITGINDLVADTRSRAKSLPRRKADIQRLNLDRTYTDSGGADGPDPYLTAAENGLIQEYSPSTGTSIDSLRREVFRRPLEGFSSADSINGSLFVDREVYGYNTNRVALFRYFLEPLGVSVDKWSMGVRGRSRTYTFADVFQFYIGVFNVELRASLLDPTDRFPGLTDPDDNAQLIAAVDRIIGSLPPANAMPTYTDIQRIFNKGCIECHGDLDYPPYSNSFGSGVYLAEEESPTVVMPALNSRLFRSNRFATNNRNRIFTLITRTNEYCNVPLGGGMMPCGGPPLSQADVETFRRWMNGTPTPPFTHGDPHIRTVDGVRYDFQAAGEFVLLRGIDVELQARHTAVATNAPLGPNSHTGLTSCVSINTAVALRVGPHRITYQPSLDGTPDPDGLQLRVDGERVQLTGRGIPLASGARVIPTTAPGGIQVESPGGAVIVLTPGWWAHYGLWYLNIDTRGVRATRGLMGAVAPGNWLPAMPDGIHLGPRPRDLNQRYEVLYNQFGNAWRVTDATSLFDYAPGVSTETFSPVDWPGGTAPNACVPPATGAPKPPQKQISLDVAEQHCGDIVDPDRRSNCVLDVAATGELGFAATYLLADKIMNNRLPAIPVLVFPDEGALNLAAPVDFAWRSTTDEDGDPIAYRLYVWPIDQDPNNNEAAPVPPAASRPMQWVLWLCLAFGLILLLVKKKLTLSGLALAILILLVLGYYFSRLASGRAMTITHRITQLEPGTSYYWKVFAEDGKGGAVESETRRFETSE